MNIVFIFSNHYTSAVETYDEKIVGGEETVPNQYPWMVRLELGYWSGYIAHCGGTLISERWVLTTNQCTYAVVNVTIVLGAHDISGSRPNTQTYSVGSSAVIIYPDYFYGKVEDDIALIKLPQTVSFSSS